MNKFIRIENELWNELARPATTFEISEKMEEPIECYRRITLFIL